MSSNRVLIVSPYHGGSHRAWAQGYARHSSLEVGLLTMPARYWKWRMHGGAMTLARRFREIDPPPDVILATDMLDLTTFRALTLPATARMPAALYMHENQLSYPLPADPTSGPMRRQGGERDLHYGFINFASMLAAQRVIFNSAYHRDSWLEALPRYLKGFPEQRELGSVDTIRSRSCVLPVGIDVDGLTAARCRSQDGPPLIVWNQRWEYDKNPEEFFEALRLLKAGGADFRLALCGESFQRRPSVFDDARRQFSEELVHFGYAEADLYRQLLWRADLTVSTAFHEFFGIAIAEAALCETLPLLPNRLSYPELIPVEFHPDCFYADSDDLVSRLSEAVRRPAATRERARALASRLRQLDWRRVARRYDAALEELMGAVPGPDAAPAGR